MYQNQLCEVILSAMMLILVGFESYMRDQNMLDSAVVWCLAMEWCRYNCCDRKHSLENAHKKFRSFNKHWCRNLPETRRQQALWLTERGISPNLSWQRQSWCCLVRTSIMWFRTKERLCIQERRSLVMEGLMCGSNGLQVCENDPMHPQNTNNCSFRMASRVANAVE